MKKGDLLFVIALTLMIGGIVFGLYAIATNLPFVPWFFLYLLVWGIAVFLGQWGKHLSNSAKTQNTPAKPSKPRNPWVETPKVEKTEKKDDIPDIWKRKDLGEQKERRG